MSTETKAVQHTAGPWNINEHTSGPAFDDDRIYIDSGMVQVAIAESRSDSTEQWANASLIAAAPEMLEALESVRQLLDEGFLVRNTMNDADPAWAIKAFPKLRELAKVEAVIRKAKGESL